MTIYQTAPWTENHWLRVSTLDIFPGYDMPIEWLDRVVSCSGEAID